MGETATAIALTEQQQRRLAVYLAQVQQAQGALIEAFTTLVIGKGVDLERFDARLSSDGLAALLTPKPGAPPTDPAPGSDQLEAAQLISKEAV